MNVCDWSVMVWLLCVCFVIWLWVVNGIGCWFWDISVLWWLWCGDGVCKKGWCCDVWIWECFDGDYWNG